jgi:hypothetical protein
MAFSAKTSFLLVLGFGTFLLGACTQPATQTVAPLGYAPVERRALTEFSLEVARTRSEKAEPISFGMLSSMFSEATPYQLNYERKTERIKLASAAPQPLPAMRSDGAIITPDPAPRKVAPRLRPARGEYFGL